MGQLMDIAQQIAAQLMDHGAEGRGLTRDDLVRQIGNAAGHAINCYPGDPTSACHSLAVFVSITDPASRKGRRGHLTFGQALKKLVQHMQGACQGQTGAAVLIADSWDAVACHEWRQNLKQIRASGAVVELYLVRNGRCWDIDS
jgi:hypothetical protein